MKQNQHPDYIEHNVGPLGTPEDAVATYQRAKRLRDSGASAFVIKAGHASPEVGTDLDPNVAGNIYEVAEHAAKPEDPQETASYLQSEHGVYDSPDAVAAEWQGKPDNGVTRLPDGTFDLRISGEHNVINHAGVPQEAQPGK